MRTKTKQQLGKRERCGQWSREKQLGLEYHSWQESNEKRCYPFHPQFPPQNAFFQPWRARSINGLFERRQTLGPIQDRMSYLPEEIDNHSVKGQKVETTWQANRGFQKTGWISPHNEAQQQSSLEDGVKPAHKWFQTTKCENLNHHYRLELRKKDHRSFQETSGRQRQSHKMEAIALRRKERGLKNGRKVNTKTIEKPAMKSLRALHPLHQKGVNFEFDRYGREAARTFLLNNNIESN